MLTPLTRAKVTSQLNEADGLIAKVEARSDDRASDLRKRWRKVKDALTALVDDSDQDKLRGLYHDLAQLKNQASQIVQPPSRRGESGAAKGFGIPKPNSLVVAWSVAGILLLAVLAMGVSMFSSSPKPPDTSKLEGLQKELQELSTTAGEASQAQKARDEHKAEAERLRKLADEADERAKQLENRVKERATQVLNPLVSEKDKKK